MSSREPYSKDNRSMFSVAAIRCKRIVAIKRRLNFEGKMVFFKKNNLTEMSGAQYFRFRLRLILVLTAWTVCVISALLYWGQMHMVWKILLGIVGFVFLPSIESVEQVFVSYEKYLKEGL